MRNASSWSFEERDSGRVDSVLRTVLDASGAVRALLVDRTGQLITSAGARIGFDSTAFASLAAADFSANDRIAAMLGADEFTSLFHQGERESVYLTDVAGRAILVILFDHEATLGMVRIKARYAVRELDEIFQEVFARAPAGPRPQGLDASWADDVSGEIDRLFGGL